MNLHDRFRLDRRPLVVAALALVVAGCAGNGRSPAPRGALEFGPGAGKPLQAVTLEALGGFVAAGYLFEQDKQRGSKRETTEHYAEERVGLGVKGSVLTPEFLTYQGTGVFGLTQAWTEDRLQSDSNHDTGELYEADASAQLFSTQFYPLSLSFTRNETLEPRVFFSRYERTNTVARGVQRFLGKKGNVSFEGTYRKLEQTVFGVETGLPPEADITETALKASGDYSISKQQQVSGSYRYQDVRQDEGGNSFTAHNLVGYHTWYPGGTRDHELRTRFEGVTQDGSLEQDLLRLDESLRSHLTEDLQANVTARIERNNTNIIDRDEIEGTAGLSHQLYESLQSSLQFFGGRVNQDDDNTTNTLGSSLNLNYQKKTPAGVLRANYSNSLSRLWVENGTGGAIDERHTFPLVPPEEVLLFARAINVESIVVTDPTGILFYREDIDYTVRQEDEGFTFIERVFTGTIPLGGTILVDYRNQLGTDFTLDTLIQNVRVEHEFHSGLTPYFALQQQEQGVRDTKGPDEIEPLDELSLIGGLEWRGDNFLLGGEFEDRDSTVVPFQAVRLRGQGDFSLSPRHTLTTSATQVWFFYEDPNRDLSVSQGTVRWKSKLTRDLSFDINTAFRYQDDSVSGHSTAFSVGGGFKYAWRQTSVQLGGAYRETKSQSSGFEGLEASIWIVRTFGDTTPATNRAVTRLTRR